MRSITQNQAVKWLDRLKGKNQSAYNDVIKALKRYEKNQNEHDCYLALNRTLFKESELTQEINHYLDEENKFSFEITHENKLNAMMKKVKQQNRGAYQKIIDIVKMAQNESNNERYNFDELTSTVEYIVGKLGDDEQDLKHLIIKELETQTVDDVISKKNLEHLKVMKNQRLQTHSISEGDEPRKKVKKDIYYNQIPAVVNRSAKIKDQSEAKLQKKYFMMNSLTNIVEEKSFLKKIQRSCTPSEYLYLIKIIKLYYSCIISKEEAVVLILKIPAFQEDSEGLSYMVNSRETERRKFSSFKPLSDANFEDSERTTFSYIPMPITYPLHCSHRTEEQKKLLNTRWVSVPFGSEDQFNIRMKNPFEYNLIKNQDQIYQFDMYMMKLKNGLKLIKSILKKLDPCANKSNSSEPMKEEKILVDLGILQIILKNANREQKQEFEYFLKAFPLDTYKILEARCLWQMDELKSIRQNFANTRWKQVGEKNFEKSLNIKSFQFKRFQKERLKTTTMVSELIERSSGKIKNKKGNTWSFDNQSQWEILNTFQPVAKSEKYIYRSYPTIDPIISKLKGEESFAKFLPAMIMSFEDKTILPSTVSYIWDYLDQAINNQIEREKSKKCFYIILQNILGFKFLTQHKKKLTENFSEQKLSEILGNQQEAEKNLNELKIKDFWMQQLSEESPKLKESSPEKKETIPIFNPISQQKKVPSYECLPLKTEENNVFYANENFYVLLRLFYTVYERLIKAKQLCNSEKKFKLFQIFLHSSIKSKQTAKFQESMSLFFYDKAYLLTSIHKVVEQLIKIIQNASVCPIINESWKLMHIHCEDIYFFLLSKQFKALNKSKKIMRFVYDNNTGLLYINALNGIGTDADELAAKEGPEMKYDYDQLVQEYSVFPVQGLQLESNKKPFSKNKMQYIVDNAIRLLPCEEKEDTLANQFSAKAGSIKDIQTLIDRLHEMNKNK